MNKTLYHKQKSLSMNMVIAVGIDKLVASKFWRLGQRSKNRFRLANNNELIREINGEKKYGRKS